MILVVIFFTLSIIISRYLDKKMKIASILFSILFFVLSFYILMLSNIEVVEAIFINILTPNAYYTLKNIMYDYYKFGNYYINICIIIEIILFIFSFVVAFVIGKKIITKIIKHYKNNNKYNLYDILQIKYIINIHSYIKRFYIFSCSLRY